MFPLGPPAGGCSVHVDGTLNTPGALHRVGLELFTGSVKASGRSRRRIGSDTSGQVSFSIIAVVILMVSAAAGTYFAKKELDGRKVDARARLLDEMGSAVTEVVQELSLCAASRAQTIVSSWSEFPVNGTRLSQAYSSEMGSYIGSSFPRAEDDFEVEVRNWTGGLFLLDMNTMDLVDSDDTTAAEFEANGTTMDYQDLPEPSAELLDEQRVSPYYMAVGNFSVLVVRGDQRLWKDTGFERPVVSALPFLESKLRAFESSSMGECSDLGRTVGSMLSTLAQLRVLEGYGMPMYADGLNTSQILTAEDVYRAVAVGLLLEQARLFRTVDMSFAAQVCAACGGSGLGIAAMSASHGRELDTGELFLWFLGKTTPAIEPRMLIAEAVQGLADQLAVKIMEYMGWLGALDLLDAALGAVGDTVDAIIAWATGEDKTKESVTSWLVTTLESTGACVDSYSAVFSAGSDLVLGIPQKQYFVEDASGALYPVWVGNVSAEVDVPTTDLTAADDWTEFYPTFKECQGSLRDLVMDSITRLSFDIAGAATIDLGGAAIDPADGSDLFSELAGSAGEVDITFDPGAILEASEGLPMFSAQYELATRMADFISARGIGLFGDDLMDGVYDCLADAALASASYPYIPDLGVPVEVQLEEIVRHDIESDPAWGVGWMASIAVSSVCTTVLGDITRRLNSSIASLDDGFYGPVVDAVASMFSVGAGSFPGLADVVEDQVTCFARQILAQKDLSAHKGSVYVDMSGGFDFWDGDLGAAQAAGTVLGEDLSISAPDGLPGMQTVPYDPSIGYGSLEQLFPTDDLLVQVRRPWEFDRSSQDYPNTHMTSIANVSATPYATQWVVSALGLVEIRACSENSALQSLYSDGSSCSVRTIRIELCMPIVLHSAWALQGVDYNPTNTFLSDAIAAGRWFCEVVWDVLEPLFGWVKDGFERLFRFFLDTFETVTNYATRAVAALSVCLQVMVETMQKYIGKLADSALAKAVRVFIDLVGTVELRVTVCGFTIIVQTNLPDLLFRDARDLLRLMVCTDRFGPGLTFGLRVAKLGDGSYDVVANGTIAAKNVVVDITVDPLMRILRRFVEVHCRGDDWGMDITIPEFEPYDISEVSTADLPGVGAFLTNIPIPMLGMSASVKAGMRLKYSPPFPTDIVVNEFEANPLGEDAGKEWVELYNPLKETKSVDGWTLSTVHGSTKSVQLDGTVPANGVRVFSFPDTAIDNGASGDPFNDGDAIVLMDPQGRVVDTTPLLMDTANDMKTQQRSWDGGPKWILRPATKGDSNGPPILLAASDFIAKALFQAFREAFAETQLSEVSASLDFLALFAKRVLNNFIEDLLSIVSEVIHEVIFYIEVVMSDASGSAGVGFRASFVVTGEAIVDLIRWLIYTFATFVVNLGRASNPIAYPAFPSEFFSDLYIRFEVLFQVGPPRLIGALGSVGDLDQKLTLVVSISPNIPAVGKLAGRDWGVWRVDFGTYLESVPREFVSELLLKDTGDYVDLWLLKASVYGT